MALNLLLAILTWFFVRYIMLEFRAPAGIAMFVGVLAGLAVFFVV